MKPNVEIWKKLLPKSGTANCILGFLRPKSTPTSFEIIGKKCPYLQFPCCKTQSDFRCNLVQV